MRLGLLVVLTAIVGGLVIPSVTAQGQVPGIDGRNWSTVWTCSNCKREIGRSAWPPLNCPHCNAKLLNGVEGGFKQPQPNAQNAPLARAIPQDEPPMSLQPGRGPPLPGAVGQTPVSPTPNAVNNVTVQGNWVMWTAFGIIGGAGLVIFLALIFWVVFLTNVSRSRTARPRRRRRPVLDDDDDDDDDRPRRRRR